MKIEWSQIQNPNTWNCENVQYFKGGLCKDYDESCMGMTCKEVLACYLLRAMRCMSNVGRRDEMKIEYVVYCHKHAAEIQIVLFNTDSENEICLEVNPCSICMSESYEKGIESVLSKGWPEMKGEL